MSQLFSIVCGPWAILPATYSIIHEICARHLRGERLTSSEIEARIGRKHEPMDGREVPSDVALIEISGVLAKRMNLLGAISGGTSLEIMRNQFQSAVDDPSIKSILLYVDSPGGSVDGTQEFASLIHSARGKKPITAWSDGEIASAAYWIAAAADEIYLSTGTVDVGSIGVVATHVDQSAREEQEGLKVTEIVAGKYKRIASSHAPLSKSGRDEIQSRVDYIYSLFVSDVAKFRGVSEEEVLENMADGRIFIGQQAVDAGLVDGMRSFDETIEHLRSRTSDQQSNRRSFFKSSALSSAVPDADSKNPKEEKPMSVSTASDSEVMARFEARATELEAELAAEREARQKQERDFQAFRESMRLKESTDLVLEFIRAGKTPLSIKDQELAFVHSLSPDQLDAYKQIKDATPGIELGRRSLPGEPTPPGETSEADNEAKKQRLRALANKNGSLAAKKGGE